MKEEACLPQGWWDQPEHQGWGVTWLQLAVGICNSTAYEISIKSCQEHTVINVKLLLISSKLAKLASPRRAAEQIWHREQEGDCLVKSVWETWASNPVISVSRREKHTFKYICICLPSSSPHSPFVSASHWQHWYMENIQVQPCFVHIKDTFAKDFRGRRVKPSFFMCFLHDQTKGRVFLLPQVHEHWRGTEKKMQIAARGKVEWQKTLYVNDL